jgi:hypothetical protein
VGTAEYSTTYVVDRYVDGEDRHRMTRQYFIDSITSCFGLLESAIPF